MSDNSDFLKEIQLAFLMEAQDHLESLEGLFIRFEKDPNGGKLVEEIFRIMHTIKGSALSAGFDHLGHVAHVVENLLVKLQKREMTVNAQIADVLLRSNDMICTYLRMLAADLTATMDTSAMEAEISAIVNQYAPPVVRAIEEARAGDIIFVNEDFPTHAAAPAPVPQPEADKVKASTDEYLRVPLRKIDNLLNNFGEQVILQSALEQMKLEIGNEKVASLISQLGKVTYELQQTAMSLRMVTLKTLFNKMERTVRDTGHMIGKLVHFESSGETTELDKTIVDELSAVVPHLLRNAVDHGIETPEERRAAGKCEQGTVQARAYHEGGFFYLEIRDNGRGLDREKILRKAESRGLIKPGQQLTPEEIDGLIFVSGFSTKDEATDISGRGVGMDAVKAAVDRSRGQLTVQSELGKGTCVIMKLPLSMAIFNGMVFGVGERRFVVPSSRIKDIERFSRNETRAIDDVERVIEKKGKTIPLVDLSHLLRLPRRQQSTLSDDRHIAFVVENNGQKIGLEIDEIIGQQRIVQKKLGKEVSDMHGVSGGAILGDGGIALILNLDQLLSHQPRR